MGDERVERATEKRRLAALIRQYGAWLDSRDRADLLAYAESIDAEADRLERDHTETVASASAHRKPSGGTSDEG